jgi:NAD(P)-dependent dehydrogenase (short-subunit alcohol dehydrogenase family)
MKRTIAGKTVIVTGASSGIGWATALAFAEKGAKVAVCARRAEKLAELGKLIRSKGADCLELTCDVSKREDAKRTVAAVVEAWGGVDILVNNAGMNEYRLFEELELDEAETIVRTNLLGPMYLVHEALPSLKTRRGHVVNVSSAAGLRGFPYMAAYSASKWGLIGFTEALRAELRSSGVTLTAFCPGAVDTPMMDKAFVDPKLARRAALFSKTTEGCARKIVRAVEWSRAELIYAEAPGFVYKFAKFFPGLTDLLIAASYGRVAGKIMAVKKPAKAIPGT